MFELYLIYREIFEQKIKKNSKLLINTNDTLVITENIEIINKLNLTVHLEDENNNNKEYYDNIIITDLNKYDNTEQYQLFEKYKKMLKHDGKVMIINKKILSQHELITNIFYYIYQYSGLDFQNIYDNNLYNILYENGLKIIDNYRVFSESIYIITNDVFILTCVYKN
jgi:hypothetical protein